MRCGGASGSAVLVRSSCAKEAPDVNRKGKQPPNMRLKLAGAVALMETVGSCPSEHRTSSTASCAGGRVARSLSAIR